MRMQGRHTSGIFAYGQTCTAFHLLKETCCCAVHPSNLRPCITVRWQCGGRAGAACRAEAAGAVRGGAGPRGAEAGPPHVWRSHGHARQSQVRSESHLIC